MKAYLKFYLFYLCVFLISASISAGLYFAYEVSVFPTSVVRPDRVFNIISYAKLCSFFIVPAVIMFLCAFTVYSCAVSTFCCLYVGSVLGRTSIMYALSEHSFFTHAAILIFFVTFAAVFIILSKEATLIRAQMKCVAPEPSVIIKTPSTLNLFKTLSSSIIALSAASLSLYMLLIYFPV